MTPVDEYRPAPFPAEEATMDRVFSMLEAVIRELGRPSERLAAAIAAAIGAPDEQHGADCACVDLAEAILAADPVLAQALADGLALAELVAALPEDTIVVDIAPADSNDSGHDKRYEVRGFGRKVYAPTLAEAATKALEALRR